MISILLFINFFKFGILCFGGGYMIIPLLYTSFVKESKLFSAEEYGNLLSISQVTPGAVSINTATYVGYLENGIIGGISASLGLCMPSFILAILVLNFMKKYKESLFIQGIQKGAKWAAFVMVVFAICFFANISIFKNPVKTEDLGNILASFSLSNLRLFELFILILTIVLSHYRVSFMGLILFSGIVGWGYSFI